MKVAALVHSYLPAMSAGSEVMMHGLLKALQKRGHDVRVVTTDQRCESWVFDGIKVTNPVAVQNDLDSDKPDVLITHHKSSWPAGSYASSRGKRVVYVIHSDTPWSKKTLHKRPNLVVFNTNWVKEQYKGNRVPSIVVHPPVDREKHATIPGNKVTFVNMVDIKGVDKFYEIAERMPELDFLAVKGGYLAQKVYEKPNIEFLENEPEMRDRVWSRTKLLLMPSEYESYGLVAVEAAMSGIPTIAHPTPGLIESLGHGGTFVHRDDVDQWVNAIRTVLSPDVWPAVSARALARSRELDTEKELQMFCETVEAL